MWVKSYLFKISLDHDLWRKVRIGSGDSLHDLSMAILNAFEFDEEHLYGFFMDNKPWSRHAYWSPDCKESPSAEEKKLCDLDLQQGYKFLFLHDFGGEWHFQVRYEGPSDEETASPVVVRRKGESPTQYSWEDADDEWDADWVGDGAVADDNDDDEPF